MDAFMKLDTNPIVKALGQDSDIDYVDQVVQFCFAYAVVGGIKGSYITRFLRSMIRCYGALAFVMPLMLNGLPSQMMKDMDHFAGMIIAAMIFDRFAFILNSIPRAGPLFKMLCSVSYSIMKANACAAGYAAFGKAFGGSMLAPFLGAFIATNGHQMIENGIGAFNINLVGNKDNKIACCGGAVIYVMSNQMGQSDLVARAMVAGLAIANDYVNLDGIIKIASNTFEKMANNVTGAMGKRGSGAMKMRGRSRTPSMKK